MGDPVDDRMLSRVAERLYWTARYLERNENLACLINTYTRFVLDIPTTSDFGWDNLIQVVGGEDAFEHRYKDYSEKNVLRFLITDKKNPGAICCTMRAARENVRTTRDTTPDQFWELVNALYLYVNDNADNAIARRGRFEFLEHLIAKMQQMTGVINSRLSREHAYHFIHVGRMLERSDMSSRIIDVAVTMALRYGDKTLPEMNWLWANLLKSLGALTAYREIAGPLIDANGVVNFIFNHTQFPRSIQHCLTEMQTIAKQLRHPQKFILLLGKTQKRIELLRVDKVTLKKMHHFIDQLQRDFSQLNRQIYKLWLAH